MKFLKNFTMSSNNKKGGAGAGELKKAKPTTGPQRYHDQSFMDRAAYEYAKHVAGNDPQAVQRVLKSMGPADRTMAAAAKAFAGSSGYEPVVPKSGLKSVALESKKTPGSKKKEQQHAKALKLQSRTGPTPDRNYTETKSGQSVEAKLPAAVDLRAPPVHYFGAAPKPREGKMLTGKSGNIMQWEAEERLCTQAIQTTTNTAGTVLLKLIGNPTVINAPRAQWAAQAFDNYMFEDVEIRWSGALGTSVSGKMCGAFDADSTDTPGVGEAAVSKLASHPGYDTTHVFTDKTWRMPRNCRRMCWTKYSTQDDSDVRMTDQWNFWALLSVPISGVTVPTATQSPLALGEWYIKYRIKFMNQTMENVILGDSELVFNTDSAVAGGGNVSTNLGSTVLHPSSYWATFGFLNYPTELSSPTAPLSSTVDFMSLGPLSTQQTWDRRSAGDIVTGAVPSQGCWLPAYPSLPMRVNVITACVPSAITSANTTINFYNVDDPTQSAYVQLVGATPTVAVQGGVQGGTIQVDYGVQRSSTGVNFAECSVYIDPSGFKSSPSRIGICIAYADTGSFTVVWSGSGVYNEVYVSALSADQQAYWGMPRYNQQGAPLQTKRICKPTNNDELQRRRFARADEKVVEMKAERKEETKDSMSLGGEKVTESPKTLEVEGSQAVFREGKWQVVKSPAKS